MSTSTEPGRGQIWLVSMGAANVGEPGKNRPAVVVSDRRFANGSVGSPYVVVPLSSSATATPLRPTVSASVSGLNDPSVAVCVFVRGCGRSRLLKQIGQVGPDELDAIAQTICAIVRDDGTALAAKELAF